MIRWIWLLAIVASAAVAESSLRVQIDQDGLVALGEVRIRGDLRFGLSPAQVHDLIQARMRLHSAQAGRLAAIGDNLSLDPCAVAGLLERLAAAIPESDDTLPERAVALQQAQRDNLRSASALPVTADPEVIAAKARIDQANLEGDVDQARTLLVSIRGNAVVAQEDIEVRGDLIFGLPKADFMALLDDWRRMDSAELEHLKTLSSDLNVNRCAMASFLATLGERGVAKEELPIRLQQIARNHVQLVAQWESLTTSDPEVERLRAEAKRAIDSGAHERATERLQKAGDIMRLKVEQTAPLAGDYARVEADIGRLALVRLQYGAAAAAFAQAHDYAKRANQPEATLYLELLAAAYQDAGDLRQAEDAFRDALRARKKGTAPADATRLAIIQNNLGTLYFARSKYAEANASYSAARKALGAAPGLPHSELAMQEAISLNGLADVDTAIGRFDAAEAHYREALHILEQALGKEDPRLMNILTNLARLLAERGRFDQAEALFQRALALASGSGARMESAAILNNLAALDFHLGHTARAADLWRQCLVDFRKVLGTNHLVTLGVRINLAAAQRRQGDLDGAGEGYREALSIWDGLIEAEAEEPDHLLAAAIQGGLAALAVARNRLDEAADHYRQALAIVDARLSSPQQENHPLVAGLLQNQAVLLERNGNYQEAADGLARARTIFAAQFGTSHSDYGTVTSNLARVNRRLGRPTQAEPLYLEAIAIAATTGDPLKVAYRNRALAKVYLDLGLMEQARTRLETAHGIYRDRLGPQDPKTLAVTAELARIAAIPQP